MKIFRGKLTFPVLCLVVGLVVFGVSYTMLGQGPGAGPGESDTEGSTGNTGAGPGGGDSGGGNTGGGDPPETPNPTPGGPDAEGEPGPVGQVNELDQAIHNDDVESLRSLLEGGANANVRDDYGNTPLYTVIQTHDVTENTLSLLNTLIQHGASVNHSNDYGATPLSFVVSFGGKESEGLAEALVKAGSNPHSRTSYNGVPFPTPYEEALEEGNFAAAAGMRTYPGHTEPANLKELEQEGRHAQMIEQMVRSTDPAQQKRIAERIIRETYAGDNLSEETIQQHIETLLDFESPHAPSQEECDDCPTP